jgi:hypothetical protein
MRSPGSGKEASLVCIACVMRSGEQGAGYLDDGDDAMPGAMHNWSAGDRARAGLVYRQLPAWSRQLIDILAAQPGRLFPISVLRQTLVEPGSMFGIEEMCEWAAPVCTAVGRHLPVLMRLSAAGEPACYMDRVAAGLFQHAADPLAVPDGGGRAALPAAGPGATMPAGPAGEPRAAAGDSGAAAGDPGVTAGHAGWPATQPGTAPGPGAVILPGTVIEPGTETEIQPATVIQAGTDPQPGGPDAEDGPVRPGMAAGPDGGTA